MGYKVFRATKVVGVTLGDDVCVNRDGLCDALDVVYFFVLGKNAKAEIGNLKHR